MLSGMFSTTILAALKAYILVHNALLSLVQTDVLLSCPATIHGAVKCVGRETGTVVGRLVLFHAITQQVKMGCRKKASTC